MNARNGLDVFCWWHSVWRAISLSHNTTDSAHGRSFLLRFVDMEGDIWKIRSYQTTVVERVTIGMKAFPCDLGFGHVEKAGTMDRICE